MGAIAIFFDGASYIEYHGWLRIDGLIEPLDFGHQGWYCNFFVIMLFSWIFSQRRTECFYENYALTKSAKRPRVPLIEESKEKLRTMFSDATAKRVKSVENLYFNKYQQRYEIL